MLMSSSDFDEEELPFLMLVFELWLHWAQIAAIPSATTEGYPTQRTCKLLCFSCSDARSWAYFLQWAWRQSSMVEGGDELSVEWVIGYMMEILWVEKSKSHAVRVPAGTWHETNTCSVLWIVRWLFYRTKNHEKYFFSKENKQLWWFLKNAHSKILC